MHRLCWLFRVLEALTLTRTDEARVSSGSPTSTIIVRIVIMRYFYVGRTLVFSGQNVFKLLQQHKVWLLQIGSERLMYPSGTIETAVRLTAFTHINLTICLQVHVDTRDFTCIVPLI
jgi:hypothetical protein